MGDTDTALVFRILEDLTPADEAALIAFGQTFDLTIEVQRQGPDSVRALYRLGDQDLGYALPDEGIHFRFKSTDFTQVNMAINRKMVRRVMALLDPGPNDRVLDLFAGIGNFTLPLAQRARWVVGVEGSETAVRRALENAEKNQLDNIECHAQDLTKSLTDCSWAVGHFDKLLLDPSRAGAIEVLAHVPSWAPERIVYVSCNPSTLARDAGILVHQHGYRLVGAGVMDMFPQTAHVESIAVFERGSP
jgi:23S rRNA (uracil1939-C5)-methyltransferase